MEASFWVWLAAGLIALLVLIIWSIKRVRAPVLNIECDFPIDELISSLAGLTLGTVVGGNKVEVHENGAFFEVLLERIGKAESSVHFETFLWKDGTLGRRLANALADRARAGKQVRVMLDATGSKGVGKDVVQMMRDAGCKVKFFHKRGMRNLGVLNYRDHRKL
ncbi:MAG: cardiolipin synthase B, partial [Ramlibacter sp.]